MSTQTVLIIIGALLIAVALIGSGNYVQFKVPPTPAWTRIALGLVGCVLLVLAFTPLATSAGHPSTATTSPSQPSLNPTASTSASPAVLRPTPSLSLSSPPTSPDLNLRCSLNTRSLHSGITVTMTYNVILNRADMVGLGAAIYDNSGNDHSTGYGDVDSIQLPSGQSKNSRPLPIPSNLPPGRYEIDAEIWPPDEVGQNGANTIADAPCAYFTVP
jgi:hypothetical protein